jgi:hypothetical protein
MILYLVEVVVDTQEPVFNIREVSVACFQVVGG